MIRALSTDSKNINLNQNYNNKLKYCSPEKECLDINALVKQSVDKINDLFKNQKLINKINEKKDMISPNMNFKNKLNNKTNFTFNINNFINLRKEDNYNNLSKNKINNTEIKNKDIKNKNFQNKKKLSFSHQIIDSNKNSDKIKLEENFNENNNYNNLTKNLTKNSNSMIDISMLKRNIKNHAINTNYQNSIKKENKNQIDYINQSNQNQKKYVIKNSYNLNNSKKSNIIKKIETKINISPLFKKRNYSFNSKYTKESFNSLNTDNNSTESNNILNNHINNTKKSHFNKKSILNKMNLNLSKSNIKLSNSTKNINQKYIFKPKYKRTSSNLNKKLNNSNKKLLIREKTLNNSLKNSNDFYYRNNKLKNINNKKKLSSTPIVKGQNKLYKNKSINFFNKSNNNIGILKKLYSKEFPKKIKTNDVFKLMLFLNEYIINNNLLDDYYIYQNRKNLDIFSKFLASKINLNYPRENDIDMDDIIKKIKYIQRFWRKRKVKKYVKENGNEEKKEMKKMVLNNFIDKSGYQSKKILGMFHNMLEQFFIENNKKYNNKDTNINKTFYYIQKLIMEDLSSFEKNELYRDYINKIIYKK